MKFLVSKSFLRGYVRALNLAGTKEWPDILKYKENDYKRLKEDWENVGKAISEGTREYRKAKF